MNQIAYEVGGVFLLAGLFIFGTMVKGFVPEVFRASKPLGILCLLAIFGFAVYRWLPELPKIVIVEAAPAAETTTVIVPEAAPVEIESPDVPAESPKQGNRVKRAVKSVGHFLHLGRRQPE